MAGVGSVSNYNYYNNSVNTAASTAPFDVGTATATAQKQASALLDSYKSNSSTVKTLKKETSDFLDKYTLSMKTLDQSANALRGDNLDKLMFDKEGKVTDETAKKTTDAVQKMVDNYNSTMKLLNDNVDRGPGVSKQLARMVTDPAPEASMKLVGVTVNKDGTLALDTEKLTEALKSENPEALKLTKDLIGGTSGLADGVHKDAAAGLNASARSLISNDVANIQEQQNNNPFREMLTSIKGNAYALNNQAVTGLLMNMLV